MIRRGKGTEACGKRFYGAVSVGERGQVVIPKDARDALGIKAGDKLVVVSHGGGALVLLPGEAMRELAKKILKEV